MLQGERDEHDACGPEMVAADEEVLYKAQKWPVITDYDTIIEVLSKR